MTRRATCVFPGEPVGDGARARSGSQSRRQSQYTISRAALRGRLLLSLSVWKPAEARMREVTGRGGCDGVGVIAGSSRRGKGQSGSMRLHSDAPCGRWSGCTGEGRSRKGRRRSARSLLPTKENSSSSTDCGVGAVGCRIMHCLVAYTGTSTLSEAQNTAGTHPPRPSKGQSAKWQSGSELQTTFPLAEAADSPR